MKIVWKVGLIILLLGILRLNKVAYAENKSSPLVQTGECVEVTPAIPENKVSPEASVGVFLNREITINIPPGPGWRLFLARDCGGYIGPTVDDKLAIRNLTTGQAWSWDFRSSDRRMIVALSEPVDLTSLVSPGVPTVSLSVTMMDVSPPAHSSSSLVLLWVYNPAAAMSTPPSSSRVMVNPPAAISPTVTPVLEPTSTPFLTPIPSPAPIHLPTLTPTRPLTPVISVNLPPHAGVGETVEAKGWLLLPPIGWQAVAVVALLAGGLLWAFFQWWATTIPGAFDIYNHDRFWKTISLERFHKHQLTFGSGSRVDVSLPGEDVPAAAARIRLQRGSQGPRLALWEVLDPDNPTEVLDQQLLEDGDELYIGSYKLVYQHYQIEPSFMEGDLANV